MSHYTALVCHVVNSNTSPHCAQQNDGDVIVDQVLFSQELRMMAANFSCVGFANVLVQMSARLSADATGRSSKVPFRYSSRTLW